MIKKILMVLISLVALNAVAAEKVTECSLLEDQMLVQLSNITKSSELSLDVGSTLAFLGVSSFYNPQSCDKPSKAKKRICRNIKKLRKNLEKKSSSEKLEAAINSASMVLDQLEAERQAQGCR